MAYAQSVRRGVPPVQSVKQEGVRTASEGAQRVVRDVVKPRPEIIMGDEGAPNPAQYYSGGERK